MAARWKQLRVMVASHRCSQRARRVTPAAVGQLAPGHLKTGEAGPLYTGHVLVKERLTLVTEAQDALKEITSRGSIALSQDLINCAVVRLGVIRRHSHGLTKFW